MLKLKYILDENKTFGNYSTFKYTTEKYYHLSMDKISKDDRKKIENEISNLCDLCFKKKKYS